MWMYGSNWTPLTPFAMVHLKQELDDLLQRPVDLAILQQGISA
jgi:predicted nucleotidyltransferase